MTYNIHDGKLKRKINNLARGKYNYSNEDKNNHVNSKSCLIS